jgi:dynein intermediate chain 2
MSHKEGGWSTLYDPTDPNDRAKWKKKIDKDQTFALAVRDLVRIVSQCIDQNNQIDLFEEYFVGEEPEHFVENITTKTLMLFKY